MRTTALKILNKSPVSKWFIGSVFLFTLLLPFTVIIQSYYHVIVSGDFLLNVESVTVEKTVKQNESLTYILCRSPRYNPIRSDINIRSFYKSESGQLLPAGQYELPLGVLYERTPDPCVPISISPDKRPNNPGKYTFCQDLSFTAWGREKSAHFCSNEYEITEK